ncbi:hypothetical protein EXU30_19965 [Shewanella maritima]|uniref:Uncharacterized protein n=1 Tax=Shewanella maritima TaxID=2520507 RepID=A0A411PMF2_9GAMM|nr:hypothetical protein [Shewanella maritima]QBF84696.1 hypothetical protein EXU30_19965 [Shewanella maritima]
MYPKRSVPSNIHEHNLGRFDVVLDSKLDVNVSLNMDELSYELEINWPCECDEQVDVFGMDITARVLSSDNATDNAETSQVLFANEYSGCEFIASKEHELKRPSTDARLGYWHRSIKPFYQVLMISLLAHVLLFVSLQMLNQHQVDQKVDYFIANQQRNDDSIGLTRVSLMSVADLALLNNNPKFRQPLDPALLPASVEVQPSKTSGLPQANHQHKQGDKVRDKYARSDLQTQQQEQQLKEQQAQNAVQKSINHEQKPSKLPKASQVLMMNKNPASNMPKAKTLSPKLFDSIASTHAKAAYGEVIDNAARSLNTQSLMDKWANNSQKLNAITPQPNQVVEAVLPEAHDVDYHTYDHQFDPMRVVRKGDYCYREVDLATQINPHQKGLGFAKFCGEDEQKKQLELSLEKRISQIKNKSTAN